MYIVAGLGRCGTTALYDAIRAALGQAEFRFVRDLAYFADPWITIEPTVQVVTSLTAQAAPLSPGVVYKTHDFAPICLPPAAKVVFLSRDASEILHSVHTTLGFQVRYHYYNLHADYRFRDQWQERDTLRLGENLASWRGPHDYPVLMLPFAELWDRERELAEFLDLPIQLPRKRCSKP